MIRHCCRIPTLVAMLIVSAAPARADEDHWNCNLRVYWESLGGYIADTADYFGVQPGATDGYDLIDSKHPGCPFGMCIYSWFERPTWGQGPIMADWRSPIAEGTSKRWGTAITDTWNIRNEAGNAAEHSGVFDTCDGGCTPIEYPVAAPVYVTWEFGMYDTPPAPLPPGDYAFALIYRGGINQKPPGTAPADVPVPAINQTWDMKTTPYVAVPLWGVWFEPYHRGYCDSDCRRATYDIAKFWIVVTNPQDIPYCTIAVSPNEPWPQPATFTFTATALAHAPYTFAWDFGDGETGAGNPVSHTYGATGAYGVTCTVTDFDGDTATCTAQVAVIPPSQPPTCDITFSPADPTTNDYVYFYSNATDPDGTVASVTWGFGDGFSGSGLSTYHRYDAAGTYLVTATVVDNHGAQGTCSIAVTVASANRPPSCAITFTPVRPEPNEVVSLDSQAADLDGTVVSVSWGFGDGLSGSGVVTTHQYVNAGYYRVKATACDNEGACATCSTYVGVGYFGDPNSHWNCNLRAWWGAVGGTPADPSCYFGVLPGATDGYDLIDSKKPGGESQTLGTRGDYVYAWFDRPAWGQGRIMADWRAPIPEGTSKRWGTHLLDTWNVRTNKDNGSSGYFHPCDVSQQMEYPVAASVYIDWEFGIAEYPPGPVPPEDYTFSLIYRGGINQKPPGTAPVGLTVPAMNQTWDMEAVPHIVVPLWNDWFQPFNDVSCAFDLADRAKFYIMVNNPDTLPTCAIGVDPDQPQEAPATFTFRALAIGDEPLTFAWDFGDGGSDAGSPVSHTYQWGGTYAVTCTVTDVDGDTTACSATVEVTGVRLICFTLPGNCWHRISLPCQPVNPDPWEVFDELRPPNQPVDLLSGCLHRYDHDRQAYVTYWRSAPSEFGPITPGDGYLIWLFEDATICYAAQCSDQPQAISLPTPGWYIIGTPHPHDTHIGDTAWYQAGSGPYPFSEIMNLWVQDPLIGWRCDWGRYYNVGLLPIDEDRYLRAFQGYWLYAFESDLTLVVPP